MINSAVKDQRVYVAVHNHRLHHLAMMMMQWLSLRMMLVLQMSPPEAQKNLLKALSPEKLAMTELAGEPVRAALTTAPGNGQSFGGIKVSTDSGWFAARPSGTEDVYKIYAESFLGPDHLKSVQAEAREVVAGALKG